MNIQRFTAPTSREALAKARMAFGEGTLILSNRPTEHGVEVVATGEDTLAHLDRESALGNGRSGGNGANSGNGKQEPSYKEVATRVEDDADQLAMSTLSFQDYVRERMAKKREEAASNQNIGNNLIRVPRDETSEPKRPVTRSNGQSNGLGNGLGSSNLLERAQPVTGADFSSAPVSHTAHSAHAAPAAKKMVAPPLPVNHQAASAPGMIERELHAMKELIEERFNTLNWLGQARQNPIQSNLMLKLIRAGYSPTLSRTILERMPETRDAEQSQQWVMDVLQRNLRTDAHQPQLHEEGGVFALIGATGVGKTTTAAKLAGLCARQYGPNSVGLITLDSYRVGAQEQLRAYGKMLGVVAHLAHDHDALKDLLQLLAGKKMVLVDTTGLAPRDPRKQEMMDLLNIPGVKKLLVLNAGNHGDTLEDTVSHFKSPTGQQVILSKVDEAVKLGPALDAAIRHQLTLRGVTTGQRVPEDWEAADAGKLIRASLRAGAQSVYDPQASDLGFIFSHPTNSNANANRQGMLNA